MPVSIQRLKPGFLSSLSVLSLFAGFKAKLLFPDNHMRIAYTRNVPLVCILGNSNCCEIGGILSSAVWRGLLIIVRMNRNDVINNRTFIEFAEYQSSFNLFRFWRLLGRLKNVQHR